MTQTVIYSMTYIYLVHLSDRDRILNRCFWSRSRCQEVLITPPWKATGILEKICLSLCSFINVSIIFCLSSICFANKYIWTGVFWSDIYIDDKRFYILLDTCKGCLCCLYPFNLIRLKSICIYEHLVDLLVKQFYDTWISFHQLYLLFWKC